MRLLVSRPILLCQSARQWGGLLDGLAIVIFFANTAYVVLRSRGAEPTSCRA
jgi:hypothetical protein